MKKKTRRKNTESWFAVKSVFQHLATKFGPRQTYEERIILVKANSFENARNKAAREAKRYAKVLDGCKFTGFLDTFHLFDRKVEDLSEIYSTRLPSNLSPEKYLDRYYPEDILNDCREHGLGHRWYNKDGKNSACYHCKVVEKGQLWKQK